MSDELATQSTIALKPEHDSAAMLKRYRNVFASLEGKLVLGDILSSGHFGVTLDPENIVQVSEYNFALVIAYKAGALDSLFNQLGIATKEG